MRVPFLALLSSSSAKESTLQLQHQELAHVDAELANTVGNSMNQGSDVERTGPNVEGEGVQTALRFSDSDAVAVYKGIVEGLYRDKRVEGQIQTTCLRGVDKWNDVIRKVKGALMIPDEIGAKFTFQREFSRMLKQTVYDTLLACNCDKIVDVSRLRIAIYFIQFGPFEYKDGRIKINYKDITGDLKIALSNWPRNYNQFGLYLGKVLKQLSPPPVPVKGKAAEAVEEEAVLIA